ncbi:hypothetical protein DFH27DRAFT_655388 [Peziza echinospora]|nr:hypothetical protein DFH27DRAFT_655388 [Peziza echinospora]
MAPKPAKTPKASKNTTTKKPPPSISTTQHTPTTTTTTGLPPNPSPSISIPPNPNPQSSPKSREQPYKDQRIIRLSHGHGHHNPQLQGPGEAPTTTTTTTTTTIRETPVPVNLCESSSKNKDDKVRVHQRKRKRDITITGERHKDRDKDGDGGSMSSVVVRHRTSLDENVSLNPSPMVEVVENGILRMHMASGAVVLLRDSENPQPLPPQTPGTLTEAAAAADSQAPAPAPAPLLSPKTKPKKPKPTPPTPTPNGSKANPNPNPTPNPTKPNPPRPRSKKDTDLPAPAKRIQKPKNTKPNRLRIPEPNAGMGLWSLCTKIEKMNSLERPVVVKKTTTSGTTTTSAKPTAPTVTPYLGLAIVTPVAGSNELGAGSSIVDVDSDSVIGERSYKEEEEVVKTNTPNPWEALTTEQRIYKITTSPNLLPTTVKDSLKGLTPSESVSVLYQWLETAQVSAPPESEIWTDVIGEAWSYMVDVVSDEETLEDLGDSLEYEDAIEPRSVEWLDRKDRMAELEKMLEGKWGGGWREKCTGRRVVWNEAMLRRLVGLAGTCSSAVEGWAGVLSEARGGTILTKDVDAAIEKLGGQEGNMPRAVTDQKDENNEKDVWQRLHYSVTKDSRDSTKVQKTSVNPLLSCTPASPKISRPLGATCTPCNPDTPDTPGYTPGTRELNGSCGCPKALYSILLNLPRPKNCGTILEHSIAVSLLEEIHSLLPQPKTFLSLCHSHLRRLASGTFGLLNNNTHHSLLASRLTYIFENPKPERPHTQMNPSWFRKPLRHFSSVRSELGLYKFQVRNTSSATRAFSPSRDTMEGIQTFTFNRETVFCRFSSIDKYSSFLKFGTVKIPDMFTHLDMKIIAAEFDMYKHHFHPPPGTKPMGWLRIMYHSLTQQAIRQDPGLYALHAAAREDGCWRMISYPYYTKYTEPNGEKTGFKHFDMNVGNYLGEEGIGRNVVQSAVNVSEYDETGDGCTILVPGFHKHIHKWWEKRKGATHTGGETTNIVPGKNWTKEDDREFGPFVSYPCKSGETRITRPDIPHGSTPVSKESRKVVFPWYIGIRDDHETLDVPTAETWSELAAHHRDLTACYKSTSGRSASAYGRPDYRWPAALKLGSTSCIGDALVGRRRWDDPEVIYERDFLLGGGPENDELAREWLGEVRQRIKKEFERCWEVVKKIEREEFKEVAFWGDRAWEGGKLKADGQDEDEVVYGKVAGGMM